MDTSQKDPVVTASERLEHALDAICQGAEQAWAKGLREALRDVEQALGRHPKPSEQKVLASAGPPQKEISPGITRETAALGQKQEAMLVEVDALIARTEGRVRSEDCPALQHQGRELVTKLRRFTAAENAMILEAVMGEPGAGD
jgi:hypothetical protein